MGYPLDDFNAIVLTFQEAISVGMGILLWKGPHLRQTQGDSPSLEGQSSRTRCTSFALTFCLSKASEVSGCLQLPLTLTLKSVEPKYFTYD